MVSLVLGWTKTRCAAWQEVALELEHGVFLRAVWDLERPGSENPVRARRRGVADDGMAERLHVDANLVGAAGLDPHLDQGEGAEGGGQALEDGDVRDGGAGAGVRATAGGHAGAADQVAGDGEVDGDVVLGEWPWTSAR